MVKSSIIAVGVRMDSNNWYWYNCVAIWKENELGPYLTLYIWINSRFVRDLNIKCEIMGEFNYNFRFIKPF